MKLERDIPRCVIDLERLKFLHCGFGQFSYCLGRMLLPEIAAAGMEPVVLTLPQCRALLPEHDEFFVAEWWRKTETLPWLNWVPRPSQPPASVWHATHQFTKFWPSDPRTPVLLTIHDLNFLREDPPEKVERQLQKLQRKVDRCAAIAVISEFVREEVSDRLTLHGKPVRVIYNGADRDPAIVAESPIVLPPRPFIFSVGSFAARKNFHTLIAMMEHLPEVSLVIAGELTTDYGRMVTDLIRANQLEGRVFLPGIVSDNERQWYYENCEALVFPSLTEGFGLPVVEAMSAGKPVVISQATSLPEIGGQDAFYWDDFDPQGMAAKVRECLTSVDRDRGYSNRVKAHAARFTWLNAARQYVAWYAELAEVHRRSAPRRIQTKAAA